MFLNNHFDFYLNLPPVVKKLTQHPVARYRHNYICKDPVLHIKENLVCCLSSGKEREQDYEEKN
jgi:hypothetical protein